MAGEREFYYTATDVRLFLAGLASSRLHLLQGISGTGKTSLPIEFFRALGGQSSVVEVQAGWRDKDDLFGFYNAFEKRFSETEFTKALYRALLPANADLPTVIVLDEMNLAHPEQYFGTMLSKLERDESGKVLDILNSPVPNVPDLFEEGSKIPLAANVWFVGTANHDETTVSFADKTYDRSHVQELPHTHEAFPASDQHALDPISFTSLQDAFARAQREHRGATDRAKRFLAADVRPLFTPFGIGWASRLPRQLDRFVPVNLAAGGSLTEAIDHVIEAKIIRKLRDQFEITPDQLVDLQEQLAAAWSKLEPGSPTRSLAKLADEARRLNGGLRLAMNGTRDRLTGRLSVPESGWTGRWLDEHGYVLDPASDRDRAVSDDLDALADQIPQLRERTGLGSWDFFAIAADPTERNSGDLLLADRETTLVRAPAVDRSDLPDLPHPAERRGRSAARVEGSSACPARHRAIQRAHRGLGWPYAPRPSPTPSARRAAGRRRGPVREPYGQ